MTYLAGAFLSAEIGRKLIAPAALLILPIALPLWFRRVAQGRTEEQRAAVWLGHLRLSRFVMAATLAGWWAIWDLNRLVAVFLPLVPWLSSALAPSSVETLLFWIPPAVSLAVFLTLANATSAALLRLKWTPANILNLVCWRMMNFVVPLLMIETGFDDLFRGELRGLVWVAAAAIVATVATAFLRKAEGMKLHTVKASETRNRALAMARKMGVTLRRIYVVPAGRGHLTNAFAGRASIGLTDNLGKYLNRQEIDFVISHELVHLQQNHGRKQRLETIAIFSAVAILLFWSRQGLCHFRPLFDVLLILVPLAASYFFSRRHEYEADRKAIDFTRNSEAGIRALAGLNLISAAPARCSKFAELFLTHPSLARRAETIGRDGEIPRDRITEILRHAGISMDDS